MKPLLRLLIIITVMGTNSMMAQWIQTNGPTGWIIRALAVSGSNIYAGTNGGGVFISSNSGSDWTTPYSGMTNKRIRSIVVSGTNIFAGSDQGGVYISNDNGLNWTSSGLTSSYVYSLAVSGNKIFAGTSGGVFTSSDNGASWTEIYKDTVFTGSVFVQLAVSGSNIFAGEFRGGGISLSTNNGSNWSAVNTGLTNTDILSLAVSGTKLFAGTSGGVFYSGNSGSSWIPVNSGLKDTNIVALAISDTNIFLGVESGGVFFSTNNGSSWSDFAARIKRSLITSITVSGSNLLAGTYSNGVFIRPIAEVTFTYGLSLISRRISFGNAGVGAFRDSILQITNAGNQNLVVDSVISTRSSFKSISKSLTIAAGQYAQDTIRFTPSKSGPDTSRIVIYSIAPSSPDTITVFGNGVATGVSAELDIPIVFSLRQNYPNPFNPSTTIHYSLPARSRVRMTVYNTLGQVVADLVNTEQAAGRNQVKWNANVASGLYFYRLEAFSVTDPNKRFVDVKKMILLK